MNLPKSPAMTIIYFVLGVVTGTAGIEGICFGIYNKGSISLGFTLDEIVNTHKMIGTSV